MDGRDEKLSARCARKRLSPGRRARLAAGVLLFESASWGRALRGCKEDWILAKNRQDTLALAPDGDGVSVGGPWSSELHAPKVFPVLGQRLFVKAFRENPIRLQPHPSWDLSLTPDITYLIGHRGRARLPHLLATLQSIAGQMDVRCECIVVEQGVSPDVQGTLPSWARYVHQPWPEDLGYGRAQAFNAGVGFARSSVVILHDNDMLVPSGYSAAILKRIQAGFEVVNLKRFIFYLAEDESNQFFMHGRVPVAPALDTIVQNSLGGGSVAVTTNAYTAVGGFDEEFVGWGGEDVDFWERVSTRRVYSWGSQPLIHLWHAPQPGKTPAKDTPAMRLLEARRRIPAEARIERLRELARSR